MKFVRLLFAFLLAFSALAQKSVTYDTTTKDVYPTGLDLSATTLSGTTKYDGSDKAYVTISGDYGLGLSYQLDGTPTFRVSAKSVQTISQLTNSVDPFAVNLFATVSVQRYSDDDVLSQGGGTFFRGSSATYPVTPGYVFPSTNPSWNWVRTGTDYVTPAMFGAFGAPNEEQNLVTGNDYNFSSDQIDPAWSGFGDAQYNPQGNSGTNYTYAIYSAAASPSSFTNRANAGGYMRNVGLASVPPGGATKLILAQRGHGYTSGSTITVSVTGDGTGATNAYLPVATNSFADGYITGGKLRLITQGSTARQEIILGYDAPNEVQIGGLIRPLQVGATYRATLKAFRVSGSALQWFVGTSTNASARVLFTPDNAVETTYTGTFVADGQIVRIGLYDTASTGQVFTLDDIVISEISSDGPTVQPPDEGSLIAAMILASPGKDILFGPNRRYYSTQGFRLNAGQRVNLQGSWIEIDVGTSPDDGFILFNNGPELHDGRITYSGTAPISGSGESTQNIISIGHFQYWDYPIAENARVYNLQLEGYGAGGNFPMGIVVCGARNCQINNIYFPDNAGLRQAIGVYWTGEQTQSVGTQRPVGVKFDNIRGGRFTSTNGNGAYFATFASIASVQAVNFFAEYVKDSFIRVTPGDIGWQVPKPSILTLEQAGVTIENANCADAQRVGYRVQTIFNYVADNAPIIQTNASVTFDTATDEAILSNHNLKDGSLVVFSGSAAPTGIVFGTRYYVTWSTKDRFMLRAEADGYGNGDVIDISTGGTSVTVTGWRGQQFQSAPVVIRDSFAHSSNPSASVAGIYSDGASGVKYENITVDGFRNGFLVDDTVANENIHIDRCVFTGNYIFGADIGSGKNIIIRDSVFTGNGSGHAGVAGSSEGVNIDNGSDILIERCIFGASNGELTQGSGIGINNGNYPLRNVTLRGNIFRSGTNTVSGIRIDDAGSATWNSSTFVEVQGNTFTTGSGITRLLSSLTATVPILRGHAGALISANGYGHLALGQTDPTDTLELVVGGTNFFSNPFPRLSVAQVSAATSASGGFWWETDATRLRYYNGTNAYTVATLNPYADNLTDLGTASIRWQDIFAYTLDAKSDVRIGNGASAGAADLIFGAGGPRVTWASTNAIILKDNSTTGQVSELWFGGSNTTNNTALKQASVTNLNVVTPGQLQVNGNPVVAYSGTPSTGQIAVYTNSAWTVMTPGSSGIGGSTGSTDNRILRSDGTGGATLQNSAISLSDETVYSSQYYVQAAAAGAQSNNHLVLSPQGSGALQLHVADGTSAGGNNRGANAVDLQTFRNVAAQVASGSRSFAAGSAATASGTYSVSIGYGTVASGEGNVALGYLTTASGGFTATAIGASTIASANRSTALGFNSVADKVGQVALAAGVFASSGDAQTSTLVVRNITSSTTPTVLFTDGSSSRLTIPNNTTWAFSIWVVGRTATATLNSYGYVLEGLVEKGTTAGSVAIVGSVIQRILAEDNAAADATAVADTSNGALSVQVTAADTTATRWVATLKLTEVTYP